MKTFTFSTHRFKTVQHVSFPCCVNDLKSQKHNMAIKNTITVSHTAKNSRQNHKCKHCGQIYRIMWKARHATITKLNVSEKITTLINDFHELQTAFFGWPIYRVAKKGICYDVDIYSKKVKGRRSHTKHPQKEASFILNFVKETTEEINKLIEKEK